MNAELKAEGEARSRVQLTLYRPLSVIFDEVVGKLGASMLNNNNKRHRDVFKFLRTGIFASNANFSKKCVLRKLKVKTKLTESN